MVLGMKGLFVIFAIVVSALLVCVVLANLEQPIQPQVLPDDLAYKTVPHSFWYVFSNNTHVVVNKNGNEYEVNYGFWKSLAIPEK